MDVIDWLVLGGSCLLVTFLGMTKTKKREGTSKELLIGSNMSVWAVTLSVCSGFISSISLLGFPAEVYYFGAIVLWLMAAYCVAFPMVAFLFLPVFYKLRLQSIYEYMELRFSRSCRFLGLAVFFTQTVLYTSVALFAPSLAVTSVTGIPLHFSIFFTACISATYISVGGARAGMHTSAIQMALIFIALLAIVVVNCYENSFIQAIKTAHAGHRLDIVDFRLDPTVRHSFWSLFLGGIGNICCLFAANQLSVQRYMSMPTLKEAQKVVLLNIPCNAAILVCYTLLGILIYSKYYLCDPNLPNMNELLPHFVLDSFSHLPGFAGLFIAAVYSAAISTLSASFTAISTVLLTEITLLHNALSSAPLLDSTIVLLSRILPFIVAVFIAILAWFCQFFKTLALQVAFTVFGAVGGPVLGTFTLGFFVPYARGHSGVVGLLCSLVACFTIAFGTVYYEVKPVRASLNGSCNNASLPFSSLDGFNWDKHGRVTANPGWLSSVSQVSYQYYSVIGVLVNLLCACLFQLLFVMAYRPDLDTIALPIIFCVAGILLCIYYKFPLLFYSLPVILGCLIVHFKNQNCDPNHVNVFFDGFRVGGHRGSPHVFPENTSQAKAEGADLIEFDIALTKCGKAVLMHDDDLDRTTNMTGPIRSKTFLDLATINVSHKFKRIVVADGVLPAEAESIPTLDGIVDWAVQNKMKMLFDVKDSDVEMVRQISTLFEEHNLFDKAIVCSFFPNVLWRIKRGNQKIITGLTWRQKFFSHHDIENKRPRYTGLKHYVFELIDLIHVALLRTVTPWFLGADLLLTNNLDISEGLVNEQLSWGRRVVVWTVNDLAEMHWMVEKLGIPILTDYPFYIKELDRMKQLRGLKYIG